MQQRFLLEEIRNVFAFPDRLMGFSKVVEVMKNVTIQDILLRELCAALILVGGVGYHFSLKLLLLRKRI